MDDLWGAALLALGLLIVWHFVGEHGDRACCASCAGAAGAKAVRVAALASCSEVYT